MLTLSYACSYGSTFEDFLCRGLKTGFRSFELIPDLHPNLLAELTDGRCHQIRQWAADNGARLTVHNVFYDINPISPVPEVQRCGLKITERAMAFANEIGGRSLTIHPGYVFPPWRTDPRQSAILHRSTVRAYKKMAVMSQEYSVQLLVENGQYCVTTVRGDEKTPLHLGMLPDELEDICQLDPQGTIRLALDLGKAAATTGDAVAFMDRIWPLMSDIHVGDYPSLAADLPPIVSTLLARNYAGDITLEMPTERAVELANGTLAPFRGS